nr:MAG: hypothetical protein [Microvirus sp.]
MKKYRVKHVPKELKSYGLKDGDVVDVWDEDNYLSDSPNHQSSRLLEVGHVLFMTPLGQYAYLLEHEIEEVKEQVEREVGEF